jgi:Dolichyl-phosphate-mannose-protein mannosyltransferase
VLSFYRLWSQPVYGWARPSPYWFGRVRFWLAKSGFTLALAGVVLVGAGLRVYALGFQSFWTDEIFSLITTDPTLTFHEFWDRVVADTHPPIYYLLLRLSSTMFGQSEIAARIPSAFFGVLTLCGAAILPWSPLSRSARLAFLLFLAISPGEVWYAREARSYGLLLLLSTGITLACVSFVRCRQDEDRKAQIAMAALTAFSVLASFTHYFGFLLAAAASLTCYLLGRKQRKPIVILAGLGVVAFFAPWVIYHSQVMDAERTTWIGKLSVAASLQWFEYLSFGGTAPLVLFSGAAAALLLTGGWRRTVCGNSTVWACTLLCSGTLMGAAAISLHTPILTSRNMIVVLPALYLIAAELTRCLVMGWGKLAGATYLAAAVGLMGHTVVAYHTIEINEQWRESAAFVLTARGCESGAIYVYGEAQNYHFFTKRVRPDLRLIEIPEGAGADLSNEPTTRCPVLLWIVGIPSWDLDGLLIRLGLSRSSSQVVEYHEAFVVLRK